MPDGIEAWTWLPAGVGAGSPAVVCETGIGDIGGIKSGSVGESTCVGAGKTGGGKSLCVGAGEPGVGKTAAGKTETVGIENCAGATGSCAGNECAASEAAGAMTDGSSEEFKLASVGAEKFAGALTAPELAGSAPARDALEFEVENAAVRLVAASGTAEVAVGPG